MESAMGRLWLPGRRRSLLVDPGPFALAAVKELIERARGQEEPSGGARQHDVAADDGEVQDLVTELEGALWQ